LEQHFGQIGVIKIDKKTREKVIKIYTDDKGVPKGDALIGYEDPEAGLFYC
jgi:RNA recognition motif-containing protein